MDALLQEFIAAKSNISPLTSTISSVSSQFNKSKGMVMISFQECITIANSLDNEPISIVRVALPMLCI